MRILIVGRRGGSHIGGSFERAAVKLGHDVALALPPGPEAFLPRQVRRVCFRGRPANMHAFARTVIDRCQELRPDLLIATGFAPLDREALKRIGKLGTIRVNYSTDDPWNPQLRSTWFLDPIREYDHVFTPRLGTMTELALLTRRSVHYLPFGYDPELFYPVRLSTAEQTEHAADVVFAGCADRDRLAPILALHKSGLRLSLYGARWNRYFDTRKLTKGVVDIPTLRKAICAAKVALCLVRRANRDGHCMRSFEVPAAGGCMLVEDTDEHQYFFGPDGHAVAYFRSNAEMVDRAHDLLSDDRARSRLAAASFNLVTKGFHRYEDRLGELISVVASSARDV